MRITKKYLSAWVNERLKEKGLKDKVLEIYATRYRSHEYENGAYRLVINCVRLTIYSHYSLADMQGYINKGEDLYIATGDRIPDWTIEVTLKKGIPRRGQGHRNIEGGLAGAVDRLIAEQQGQDTAILGVHGKEDPYKKATELLRDFLEEVDAYTGGRQTHTPILVKRLLNRLLTEIIGATEVSDPPTASFYRRVKECLSTVTIKQNGDIHFKDSKHFKN